MQSDKTSQKPSIIICIFPHEGCAAKLREVQAGMEEEGVPCSLLTGEEVDAIALAYRGAYASPLGVGVGISTEGMCIHYQKLPERQPLFVLDGEDNLAEWRRFGYNAARLVKGLPFKSKQIEAAGNQLDTSQLYASVREIVLKVLQEFAQGHGEVNTWSKTP
ncbi:glycerol dehydratase reactivase beta/small subunit family protein [Sporomusa malonica]|uniref:Propanediol dehydratase reactivation factor, small subunit n=1 Tax=Sporomusa malonica TaxID=112901 RepID=A0A1W1YEH9_9FIRM|nr:glycerol dehydratase reactivase beta/small subunit family protein [Sporomusa malonica]SMC34620.1 propanediol dehydratase reactivation factor, small subunit [Sporomusa malonica]